MNQRLHFFMLGVLAGAAVTAMVFISRDVPASAAQAPPPAAAAPAAASPATVPKHDDGGPPLPPEAEAQRQAHVARLVERPDDVVARKRLALLLLSYGHMMAAFEQASQILAAAPSDPDGLYVHGEVRLAMGSLDQAIALLDRVLAQYPGHVRALTAKGRAQFLGGAPQQAVATWEAGLAAAGGRHDLLEELLAQARGEGTASAAEAPGPIASH